MSIFAKKIKSFSGLILFWYSIWHSAILSSLSVLLIKINSNAASISDDKLLKMFLFRRECPTRHDAANVFYL